MGKKGEIGRKRKLQAAELDGEDGEEPMDPELQAELNAVLSMRAERGEDVAPAGPSAAAAGSGGAYKLGKEALMKATESLGTHALPFIESMQICKFDLSIDDENDDLAREVCASPTCTFSKAWLIKYNSSSLEYHSIYML